MPSAFWKKALSEWGTHSWEEVLTPEERLGGPSQWGSSRWGVFKRCPYLYYFQYVKGMRLEEVAPQLEIGGLFHEARARYYLAYSQDPSDNYCIQQGYDIINRAEKVVPHTAGEVRRLYKGWLVARGPGTPSDDRDRTKGVEILLEYYDAPFPYSTRLDRWFLDDEGRPCVMEIKTAARRSGDLLSSYRMDSQFIGQQYLWRKCLEPEYGSCSKYVVDLAVKTNPAQYAQEIVPIDYRMMRNWEHEMTQHYIELQRYERSAKPWPRRRSYHSCKYCDLFDHCASGGKLYNGWVKK